MALWRRRGIGLVLLAVCILLAGCARPVNRAAERRIREALPLLLGPARDYHVHVGGAPLNTLSGKLAQVVVDAGDLQLPNGLLLEHLHLDLRDVDFDTQRKELRHVGSAHFLATVDENALTLYLLSEEPPEDNLKSVDVRILPQNQILISGEKRVLGVGISFRIAGPLVLQAPNRITFDPQHLTLEGIHVPDLLFGFLKHRFETAINLSNLPFPIHLIQLKTQPRRLFLSGEAEVEGMAERVHALAAKQAGAEPAFLEKVGTNKNSGGEGRGF